MAKLILHSDDFGLHPQINRAILDAAARGRLSSASLLVNGMAAEDAITGALNTPKLGVGIHLNILRGRPLSDPDEIPTLVSKDGRFFNSPFKLLLKSALGKISAHHVHTEYRRQVLFMMEGGLVPTHFDGEKHTHLLLPEAVRAVKKLNSEFGIQKVRRINETSVTKMLPELSLNYNPAQRLKLALLEYRSRSAGRHWIDLKCSDFSFGVLLSGRADFADMLKILKVFFSLQRSATIEWMFHLGYPFDINRPEFKHEFGHFFLNASREKELQFLLSAEVLEVIEKNTTQLISYREL